MITMVVDGAQVREALLGEDGVAAGAAPEHAVRRHVDDRAAQTRAIGAQLAERGIAPSRRAGHRLLAEGRRTGR